SGRLRNAARRVRARGTLPMTRLRGSRGGVAPSPEGWQGMRPLQQRRAFVTGASSGIGAATGRMLVEAGARVALVARNGEGLADVARRLDGRATSHACDVRDERQVPRAVRDAAAALGGLDLVVPAAGLGRSAPAE